MFFALFSLFLYKFSVLCSVSCISFLCFAHDAAAGQHGACARACAHVVYLSHLRARGRGGGVAAAWRGVAASWRQRGGSVAALRRLPTRMRTRDVFGTFFYISVLNILDISVFIHEMFKSVASRTTPLKQGSMAPARAHAHTWCICHMCERAHAHTWFFCYMSSCCLDLSVWGLSWASPGLLLGLSCVLLGSPGPLLGLSWASSGPLLGLSWVLETCRNYERGCFVSQIPAAKWLRVQGVGFVLQNTAPNASP
jgi:hypothetical protein